MAIICSDAEVKKQLEYLYKNKSALRVSDWEDNFIESCWFQTFHHMSAKMKATISKIYFEKKDKQA